MPYLAGEPVIAITTLRDTTGALVTGATWSVLLSRHQSGRHRVTYYAQSNRRRPAGLHRLVMNAPSGMVVDHINHDTLDCRKSNLRLCDSFQNSVNRLGPNGTTTSGVLNVYWVKRDQKWKVILRINGTSRSFGQFHSLEEATEVAKQARLKYFGEFATHVEAS